MTQYQVINMTTSEIILCNSRAEGRELAERLSIETPHLWFLLIVTQH